MSVKIRLRRVGRKKQPSYRLVVTDSATARDGQYIEVVGFYNPRTRPAELRLDLEKLDAWMAKGAGLSDTVASLVRKARRGGDDSVQLKAAPVAQAAPAAEAAEARAAAEPEAAAPAKAGSRGKPKAAAPVEAEAPAEAASMEAEAPAEAESAEPAAESAPEAPEAEAAESAPEAEAAESAPADAADEGEKSE